MLRPCQATDPRDKIFCMLGFASDVYFPGLDLVTDYRTSPDQVYTDFVVCFVRRHGNLEFLGHYGQGQEKNRYLPSWIPSWSEDLKIIPFPKTIDPDVETSAPIYSASGWTMQRLAVKGTIPDDLRVLKIFGLKVASTDRKLGSLREVTGDEHASAKAWKPHMRANIFTFNDSSIDEAFARTLVADCRRTWRGDTWTSDRILASEPLSSILRRNVNPY
jgi:hypothetical protein